MADSTDFKNREYRMLRIDGRQEFANKEVWQDLMKGGWEIEPTPEGARWKKFVYETSGPNRVMGSHAGGMLVELPRVTDSDPIFVLSYSRPRTISP